MDYTWEQIKLATCLDRLAWVFVTVAILAFVTRSRLIFFLGIAGSLLGFLIPEMRAYENYRTVEAARMGGLRDTANHVVSFGIVGAFCGCLLGLIIRAIYHQRMDRQKNQSTSPKSQIDES